jgi:hypothetical protein
MYSQVSSDWLPSYIQATRLVLEIFKMAGCFPDSPRMHENKQAFSQFTHTPLSPELVFMSVIRINERLTGSSFLGIRVAL